MRSRIELNTLVTGIRKAVHEVTPEEPIYDVRTLSDRVALALGAQRFSSVSLGVFASLALILASVGIYAVMAYTVVERTHEIGIRMALGADQRNVLRMILGQAAKIAILGLSLGTATALITTRALASMLYAVDAKDPAIFAEVGLSLLVIVLFAGYVPARRATKIDPLVALRCE